MNELETPTWRRASPSRVTLIPLLLLGLLALACRQSLEERVDGVRDLYERGAFEESVEELRRILHEHPDDPGANLLLGTAQLRLGRPSLAIFPLQIASRAPDTAGEAELMLGGAYLSLAQYVQALEAADRVLAGEPDRATRLGALRLRTGVQLATEEWDAAIEDADRLLALEPESAGPLALRAHALIGAERPGDAEKTLLAIWQSYAEQDPDATLQAGIGLLRLYQRQLDDEGRAEAHAADLVARFPQQPRALEALVAYWDLRGLPDRGDATYRDAIAEAPTQLELRTLLAERLRARGDTAAGDTVLLEASERSDSPEAWLTLAEYRSSAGRYPAALEAMRHTLERVPSQTDPLRFKHAAILLATGDLDAAEQVAGEIEQEDYRDLMLGQIAFERGDMASALAHLDRGLRPWPNNAGARYLAGMAAYRLGDVERMLSELREAVRIDVGATNAGVDLARIELGRGRPARALGYAALVLQDPNARRNPERTRDAAAIAARAQLELGDYEAAADSLRVLGRTPGSAAAVVALRGELLARTQGPSAAAESIETTPGLDLTHPSNESFLRQASDRWIAAGEPQRALALADRAVEAHPEAAAFHDLRARILAASGQPDAAHAEFEQALALNPDDPAPMLGLAQLADASGDEARARELRVQAAEIEPRDAARLYAVAQRDLAAGDVKAAERWLGEVLALDPLHAQANNDLAWILAEQGGDLKRALVLARRGTQGAPSAETLDTLGWVHFKRGDYEAAADALGKAHLMQPESPSIAYRLSLALLQTGGEERARALLREALDTGTFPEEEAAREQLARLAPSGS